MAGRKNAALVALFSLAAIMSCEENVNRRQAIQTVPGPAARPSNPGSRVINYSFNGKEGDPIPRETADRWISNFEAKNPTATGAFFFGRDNFAGILSKEGCVGIRIYYSIDDAGSNQLLLVGSDQAGNDLLPRVSVKGQISSAVLSTGPRADVALQSSAGETVSPDASTRWINNYGQQNPTNILAHFFGNEIINQILGEKGCQGIRIFFALNDDGIQQLLLVGTDGFGGSLLPLAGGRTKSDGPIVGDASYPCPTYCSGG